MKSSTQWFFRISDHNLWLSLALAPAMSLLAQDRAATITFHDRAEITHNGGTAKSFASNPRPLNETVLALSEEYGWQVDYEDPVYDASTEIADAADPAWRALHPDKTKVIIPSGGAFQVEYAEAAGQDGKVSELQVLQSVVASYDQSANLGRFFLEKEPGGRISVVGISKSRSTSPESQKDAFLSTKISLPTTRRTLDATIEAILDAVTEKTGVHAVTGSGPTPQFMQRIVTTVGGNNVTARDLLRQSLDQSGRTWLWSMLFEPTYRTYHFNVLPVMVATVDSKGWRHLVSVDPPPQHPR